LIINIISGKGWGGIPKTPLKYGLAI